MGVYSGLPRSFLRRSDPAALKRGKCHLHIKSLLSQFCSINAHFSPSNYLQQLCRCHICDSIWKKTKTFLVNMACLKATCGLVSSALQWFQAAQPLIWDAGPNALQLWFSQAEWVQLRCGVVSFFRPILVNWVGVWRRNAGTPCRRDRWRYPAALVKKGSQTQTRSFSALILKTFELVPEFVCFQEQPAGYRVKETISPHFHILNGIIDFTCVDISPLIYNNKTFIMTS